MTNKRFISILITIFLLFVAVFGSAGCGGGGSSNPTDNEANNPIPRPEPTPEPEPDPAPAPTVYYTITFNSQGGSSVPSQRVKSGETVTKPVDPTRDRYTFTGWYKSANGTTQFKFGSDGDKVTRDITLYAKWSEVPKPETYYTVTFDSRGGSSVPTQSVSYGETISKPSDPVRNGYTFIGWYKDSMLTEAFRFDSGGDKVTSNITLYAKWIMSDNSRADIAVKKRLSGRRQF